MDTFDWNRIVANLPDSLRAFYSNVPKTAVVAAAASGALVYFATRAYNQLVRKTSILYDLDKLGEPGQRKGGEAIVVGGSWAGLLIARVLLDHFDHVTIIDSEDLDLTDTPRSKRPHVPQYGFPHVTRQLLNAVLPKLFPNLRATYDKENVQWRNVNKFYIWLFGDRMLMVDLPGFDAAVVSRDFHERTIRKLVLDFGQDRLTVKTNNVVQGLLIENDEVRGVDSYDSKTRSKHQLVADFVVDATGRSARGPKWLESANCAAPPLETYDPLLSYSTAIYEWPTYPEWVAYYDMGILPSNSNWVYIGGIENNRCHVGVVSVGKYRDKLPLTHEEYMAYLDTTAHPEAAKEVMREYVGKQVSPFEVFRPAPSKWNHYEVVPVPEGFVAVGDALTAFNPVFGQGLTTSGIAAVTLDKTLRDHQTLQGVSNDYFQRVAPRIKQVWMGNAAVDYSFPDVQPSDMTSRSDPEIHFNTQLMRLMCRGARVDAHVAKVWSNATGMMMTPIALMNPRLWWGLARGWWRYRGQEAI
ncbi:hypothetical protein HDV00_012256 [Rhizophlyctis rosea]|nr:hypothetical protein HDV00_012256 [Rhizophlyctis rosea]